MRAITKVRTPARRYNVAEVAEIRRLAIWYEGIAIDWAAAGLPVLERKARLWAARLRAKVADR